MVLDFLFLILCFCHLFCCNTYQPATYTSNEIYLLLILCVCYRKVTDLASFDGHGEPCFYDEERWRITSTAQRFWQ